MRRSLLGTGTLATVNGLQEAAFKTTALTTGSQSITAVYGGDSTLSSSTSVVLTQTVMPA